MKVKCLSILLAAVMLLALFPFAPAPANAQENEIDAVTVTVTPPSAGTGSTDAKASITVTGEGIASYTAHWQDHTGHRSWEPETLDFIEGDTYFGVITVNAAEGRTFKKGEAHSLDIDACDYTFGGELQLTGAALYGDKANVSSRFTPEFLRIWVTVTAAAGPDTSYIHVLCTEGGTADIYYEGYQGETDQPYAVPEGAEVTLSAVSEPGYVFKGWYKGDVNASSYDEMFTNELITAENPYVFNATGYPYICAKFEYTGVKRQGDQIQVWVADGGTASVTYTPTYTDDAYIKAKDGSNYVSVGEIVPFWKGDAITVNAKPDEGYTFKGWYHVNIEWGPGEGEKYEGAPISTAISYTYKPGETVVPGDTEPLRYICAVFEKRSGEPGFLLGDVDYDGEIKTGDARLALRIAIGLESAITPGTGNYRAADIDLDGEVKTGDARLILRRAIGIIDEDKWGVKQ